MTCQLFCALTVDSRHAQNVMKLGHNKRLALEEEEGCSVPPVRKIRAWQIGVGLFIAGNLLNFGSFAFAVSLT